MISVYWKRLAEAFQIRSNHPILQFIEKKKTWLAICLAIIIAAGGSTFAWQVHSASLKGGSLAGDKVKIQVSELMYRVLDGETEKWEPLADSDFTFSSQDILSARQVMFSIENQGDDAAVFVDVSDILGVELATSAFQLTPGEQKDLVNYTPKWDADATLQQQIDALAALKTHIWFDDVLLESSAELGINQSAIGDIQVTSDDVTSALKTLLDNLETLYKALVTDSYYTLLNDYEAKLRAAKTAPEDTALGVAAYEAKKLLDKADNDGLPLIKERERAYGEALKKYYDALLLSDALVKGKEAVQDADDGYRDALIQNQYLVASNGTDVRPLKSGEISYLLGNNEDAQTRNITVETFPRYGDITTELGVTPIYEVYTRNDGNAFVIQMGSGAKIDIVFNVSMPVNNFGATTALEDNLFNGVRIWLGDDDLTVVGTNNSALALKDLVGVDIDIDPVSEGEFTPMTRSKKITVNGETIDILPLEDAIGFQSADSE
ncbi:MAG: hypothetical protein LBS84_07350 [Clostridiales bacterium]|jgi:hypothetical protein|nr:hypothetical protein [Clostridiales bacterium]